MPTTEYITLDASGSNSTTLNDAPSKVLDATVTAPPLVVRSPIRYLAASASSAVSIKRVITKTLSVSGVGIPSFVKLVGHLFNAGATAISTFIEKHWGPRPFAVVRAQNNWVISDNNQWLVISTNNWTETILGD